MQGHSDNLVAIKKRVLDATPPSERRLSSVVTPSVSSIAPNQSVQWTSGGMVGRIQDVLNRKGQVILYGPPGTGKTYWSELAAVDLAALWNCGQRFTQLNDVDRTRVFGSGLDAFVQFCTFHAGYGYEDFIEGFRPALIDGTLHFERRDGLFKHLCEMAARNPARRYYLIIDEINRGDIPRIFGELLTLLDKPKRGSSVTLPLSTHAFLVPTNVLVIGTMNTADRSIALLDTALRRRFGFLELLPDATVLGDTVIMGIPLGPWLTAVNQSVATQIGRDGRNLQIGHSYFLNGGRPIQDFPQFSRIIQEDILPLLEEYCYDEWETLERILGPRLVDVAAHRFRSELFDPNRQDALVEAILAATPDVTTSAIAVAADVADQEARPEDVNEEDEDA
jgi:5-methylcytosine-specific restriction enzyme B